MSKVEYLQLFRKASQSLIPIHINTVNFLPRQAVTKR